ncbi:hypothetical protein MIND_00299600 [Mycena indigotica]|uniref:Uncharacterized protein n=1 Tax=Mycena indigotica TaxID=2126181 RepID=A0A8H6T1I9_9AGAR|nr:uncharacterized protein MIND_00299600 [Mycena indigotica]KAF7309293.1 hypothetical protein MIND_00299600 [Mycena indigotica]
MHTTEDSGVALTSGANWGPSCRLPFAPAALLTAPDDSPRPAQFFSTRSNEDTRRQRGRYTRHCSWWSSGRNFCHRAPSRRWIGGKMDTRKAPHSVVLRVALRNDLLVGSGLAPGATLAKSWPFRRMSRRVSAVCIGRARCRQGSAQDRQSARGRLAAEVFKTSGPTAGPALADLCCAKLGAGRPRSHAEFHAGRLRAWVSAARPGLSAASDVLGRLWAAALERKSILVLQGRRTRQERLARHILDALDPSRRAMYSAFAVDRVVHTIDSVSLLLQLLKVRKRTGQRLALRSPISVARNSSLASRVLARSAWRFQATVWVCAVLPLSSEARGVPARIAAVGRGNLRPDSEHTPAHLLGIASGTTPSSCRSAEQPALAQVKPDVPCAFCLQTAAISTRLLPREVWLCRLIVGVFRYYPHCSVLNRQFAARKFSIASWVTALSSKPIPEVLPLPRPLTKLARWRYCRAGSES